MQTPLKALQLILFTIEDKKSKTLLEDSLSFHPGYKAGDVIHILQPLHQSAMSEAADHQYVVQRVKQIITQTGTTAASITYVLLVEVVELAAPERDELASQPSYRAMN